MKGLVADDFIEFACGLLACSASSGDVERVFSRMAWILGSKRTRLTKDRLTKLTFVRSMLLDSDGDSEDEGNDDQLCE